MKRKHSLLTIVKTVWVLLLCAILCSCTDAPYSENGKLNIVTVDFVQYDFARSICQNSANIKMIMKPGAEIHGYEPSLSDITTIRNADLFIYNGGESDVWIDKILESFDSKDLNTVRLMDYAVLIEEAHSAHSHSHNSQHSVHDHTGEDECTDKHGYDEHIWTSPSNAVIMLDAICNAVCDENPEMTNEYQKNKSDYAKEIMSLGNEFKKACDNSESRFAVVADRFPFLYLFHEYDIDYMAVFPGCSHENDANPSVIIDIIEKTKTNNIPCIFYTETSDQKAAETICNETGAEKKMLHSCQRISKEDFENGVRYADIMEENFKVLKEVFE